jgi:ATP-dependent protease HslVU (ClpYQ) peptidase subunit
MFKDARKYTVKRRVTMSCVVALLHNGKLYMGADGISTNTNGEHRPVVCEKIFWNGQYLLGFTGSIRTGQLLKSEYFDPPDDIIKLPDAIYDHFSRKGVLGSDEEGMGIQQSNFLIGFKGRLYDILSDFQLNETYGDYNSIGSGSMMALGSFYTSKRFKTPEKRVLAALKAAAKFSFAVGPPYTIEIME